MIRFFPARALLAATLTAVLVGALPAQAWHVAAANNTLTIGVTSDALTLDPTLTTDEASGPVENLLFNSLVKLDDKARVSCPTWPQAGTSATAGRPTPSIFVPA